MTPMQQFLSRPAPTWEEWDAQLAANRRANIEKEADPARKAHLIAVDAHCNAVTAFATSLTEEEAA